MTKQELQDLLNDLRKQTENGKHRFDPALANLFFKTEAEVGNDVEAITELFKKKRDREPTPEEIAAAYVVYEEKKQEKMQNKSELEKSIEQRAQEQLRQEQLKREQERLAEEMKAKQAQDVTYDLDINRKLAQLTKGLKQKSEQEMNRDYLTLGAKFFADIPLDRLPEVLEYLKDEMGFEFKGNEHGSLEQEGREISEETITKEELEKGDVKISIPKEKLQSKDFKELLNDKEQELDNKALEAQDKQDKEPQNGHDIKQDDGYDDR